MLNPIHFISILIVFFFTLSEKFRNDIFYIDMKINPKRTVFYTVAFIGGNIMAFYDAPTWSGYLTSCAMYMAFLSVIVLLILPMLKRYIAH
ncbi:MAG: hypothetical protein ACJAZS_000697 [Alteromonas naphthalenivorans]|jgi:hypothetical protein